MKKILLTIISLCFMSQLRAQNSKIDSLQNSLKTMKEDSNKVNTLNQLGLQYGGRAEYEKALNYFNDAKSLSEKIKFQKGVANALGYIGGYYYGMAKYPEALSFYLASLRISEQFGDKKGIANSYNRIGLVHSIQGNYPEALKYIRNALKINMEIGFLGGIANSKINIGLINSDMGNYPEALKNYLPALEICEKIDDKNNMAVCYNNIGFIYELKGEYDKALENYESSLKYYREIPFKGGIAMCYNNIGLIYNSKGNFSEALKYIHSSLKLSESINDTAGIADCYVNLGRIYFQNRDYTSAKNNYLQCLEIYNRLGVKIKIANTYIYIGQSYCALKEFSESEKYLSHALSLSEKMGYKELIKLSYFELSKLDSSLSKSNTVPMKDKINYAESSLENYKKYIIYKDSLSNEENTRKAVQASMNYSFEKREAATKAAQEKKDALTNEEIKRQTIIRNTTLGGVGVIGIFSFLLVRASNRKKKSTFDKQVSEVEMKALRSQMNPHFIFNALQSVNDFILKKDTMNASNFLIKFSKLMRAVLENSVHKEVTIEKDIASLELYMQLESSRLDIPFDYEIIIDPKIDPETTFIPPLILQPFVENSIWHGLKHKKEKGKITIEIKEEGNSIVCSIEDNGVGREKANELKQPMPEKRESLGMKLTKERLRILEQIKNFRSRIDVIDLKDALNNPLGLRVELSLPLATLN